MKNLLMTTAFAIALTGPAFAAGSHSGGHDDDHADKHAEMMAVGKPGTAADVTRTIAVAMRETDDGDMIFEPDSFAFEQGETIRFEVTNKGELEHEFVIDNAEGNAKHKDMMAKMDMEHDDPNSVRLEGGQSGEVIWTFANAGTFEFAMYGPIEVSAKAEAEAKAAEVVYTKGTVKKVDTKGGKVTIDHGPLVNLDMPAMTMVFRADETMIGKLSAGQSIEFVAEPVKGKLTVVELK